MLLQRVSSIADGLQVCRYNPVIVRTHSCEHVFRSMLTTSLDEKIICIDKRRTLGQALEIWDEELPIKVVHAPLKQDIHLLLTSKGSESDLSVDDGGWVYIVEGEQQVTMSTFDNSVAYNDTLRSGDVLIWPQDWIHHVITTRKSIGAYALKQKTI